MRLTYSTVHRAVLTAIHAVATIARHAMHPPTQATPAPTEPTPEQGGTILPGVLTTWAAIGQPTRRGDHEYILWRIGD
jgi:hypothetical protein